MNAFGDCVVRIQDSGVGMTEEQIDALFGEFVQHNAAALQQGRGSGLGLFITKGIVERHDGQLEAFSGGLGQGSMFELQLPVFHVESSENNTISGQSSEFGIPSDQVDDDHPSALDILIVDDAATNRKLLRRLLERQGHRCEEAENGEVAVEKVQEAQRGDRIPFDTILMDYEMPVMDGPTAAKAIRYMGCDHYFIVGVTGNMLTEDVEYFVSCGANAVLPKPLKLSKLECIWKEHGISHRGESP